MTWWACIKIDPKLIWGSKSSQKFTILHLLLWFLLLNSSLNSHPSLGTKKIKSHPSSSERERERVFSILKMAMELLDLLDNLVVIGTWSCIQTHLFFFFFFEWLTRQRIQSIHKKNDFLKKKLKVEKCGRGHKHFKMIAKPFRRFFKF